MHGGLFDAQIDGCGSDVNSIKLYKNVCLVPDRGPSTFNPILAGIKKRSVVSEQQECAGLRLRRSFRGM